MQQTETREDFKETLPNGVPTFEEVVMFQKQANLKGYQIPKKNCPIQYEKMSQVDNETIKHPSNHIQIPKEGKKPLQETSDDDSLDCESTNSMLEYSDGDSGNPITNFSNQEAVPNKNSSTLHQEVETCGAMRKLKYDQDEPDEYTKAIPKVKHEFTDNVNYVVIKCEDEEMEFIDVFTQDGEIRKSLEDCVFFHVVDSDNDSEEVIDDILNDDRNYHDLKHVVDCPYEMNETQEMLDLELGAVETVESEESFDNDEDNEIIAGLDLSSNNVDFSEVIKNNSRHENVRSLPSHDEPGKGNGSSTWNRNDNKHLTRNPHSSQTNLLSSVLEKTLLIKLQRCDDIVNIPRGTSSAKLLAVSKTNDNDHLHMSPKSVSTCPSTNDIVIKSLEPLLSSQMQVPQGSCHTNKLKRKYKRKRDEEWDIVNLADLNNDKCSIKLKIKRRCLEEVPRKVVRVEETTEQVKLLSSQKNTSTSKFFNGSCKLCRTLCSFEESRTFYFTFGDAKPFSCCTCCATFSEAEWSTHNKTCHTLQELSSGNDIKLDRTSDAREENLAPTFGDRTVKQRDFICLLCFMFMSKLN